MISSLFHLFAQCPTRKLEFIRSIIQRTNQYQHVSNMCKQGIISHFKQKRREQNKKQKPSSTSPSSFPANARIPRKSFHSPKSVDAVQRRLTIIAV